MMTSNLWGLDFVRKKSHMKPIPVLNLVTLMTGAAVGFETLETRCCKVWTMDEAATTGSIVICGIAPAREINHDYSWYYRCVHIEWALSSSQLCWRMCWSINNPCMKFMPHYHWVWRSEIVMQRRELRPKSTGLDKNPIPDNGEQAHKCGWQVHRWMLSSACQYAYHSRQMPPKLSTCISLSIAQSSVQASDHAQ